jgi:hypothetical protein
MDRITESLLDTFSDENGLGSLPQNVRFEHFAGYVTVRRQYSETFDSAEIVCGDGSDTGIDAIAVIVNGSLVMDVDALKEVLEDAPYLEATFVFVQAERSQGFDAAKIGTFSFGVQDFFKEKPALPRNSTVQEAAEIMAAIYDKSMKFRGNPACRLYYVTTGKWNAEPALEARRKTAISDLEATQLFGSVEFIPVGAADLQKLYALTKNSVARDFTFTNRTEIPDIPGINEAYLGFIPASQFLPIVRDESGEIMHSIFYDNVRDWQGYDADVNKEIKDTLLSDHKARFVLMNNGITIIARAMQHTASKFHIEDFQIVNGCQTSHVLFDQEKNLDDSIMIPLRLIATQDESVIESIIHATNRQTEIKPEQFFAITEFARQLEAYFKSFPESQQLYYERRSRQYDRLPVEKTRIITQASAVKSFAAMFLDEPHTTTRNYKYLQEKVGKEIFVQGHRLEMYYTACFALYRLEYFFRSQRLDKKYKPARFHMLMAFRMLANSGPVPKMNAWDMEKYCKKIIDILLDTKKADELFDVAAKTIEAVAKGNFHRDNIRTVPFTQNLIARLRSVQ